MMKEDKELDSYKVPTDQMQFIDQKLKEFLRENEIEFDREVEDFETTGAPVVFAYHFCGFYVNTMFCFVWLGDYNRVRSGLRELWQAEYEGGTHEFKTMEEVWSYLESDLKTLLFCKDTKLS